MPSAKGCQRVTSSWYGRLHIKDKGILALSDFLVYHVCYRSAFSSVISYLPTTPMPYGARLFLAVRPSSRQQTVCVVYPKTNNVGSSRTLVWVLYSCDSRYIFLHLRFHRVVMKVFRNYHKKCTKSPSLERGVKLINYTTGMMHPSHARMSVPSFKNSGLQQLPNTCIKIHRSTCGILPP